MTESGRAVKALGPKPNDEPQTGAFGLTPKTDAEGNPWPDNGTARRGVWDWDFYVKAKPDRAHFDLAIRISNLADAMRAFGLPDKTRAKERTAAISIMYQLVELFCAVLAEKSEIGLDRAGQLVDKYEADFLRRVVSPQHRRNLSAPIAWALLTLAVALVIGFFWDLGESAPAEGFDAGLRAMSFVVAGTVMGRILFFAISFTGRITSMAEFYKYESMIGEAAPMSALFDVIVGVAAFAVFKTGLLVIAIGPEGADGAGSSAISTLQITSDWMIAFVMGMLVGLSRASFLGRLASISKEKISTGGPAGPA